MKIKPLFYTIEDACKRTGYSETELFTICCQGDMSLCCLFNIICYGVIQISDDELEKLPYCEESEYSNEHPESFNKKLEGKGFSVKIKDASLQDAAPTFHHKKNIERFRQAKYHECLWAGLMKIPSKFIRHDGYVLAEWITPYGFDGLRIVYAPYDLNVEENNKIVKVIPSEELEDENQQTGDVGSDDIVEHWPQRRSAIKIIDALCEYLGLNPEDYRNGSNENLKDALKQLTSDERIGCHPYPDKKNGKLRMSYGQLHTVLGLVGCELSSNAVESVVSQVFIPKSTKKAK